MECPCCVLIGRKRSCQFTNSMLIGYEESLWNVPAVCWLVENDLVNLTTLCWLVMKSPYGMSLLCADSSKTILFNIPSLCWLVNDVSKKYSWSLLIGPKQSCLSFLVYADWSQMFLRNIPCLWLLVQNDTVALSNCSGVSLVSTYWSIMILWICLSLCWLVKNVSEKCPWHLPIGPNLPNLCRLVRSEPLESPRCVAIGAERISMVLWMIVVLDSGLDALVIVTAQTFGRTQVCFNDVLVWLSMNPPAVYLVDSCLPELSITEAQYIPSNYG